jgi:hypothetical protein
MRVELWRGSAPLLANRHDVTRSRFYAAQCHIVPVGRGRALSLKKAMGRVVLVLAVARIPTSGTVGLAFKDWLANHLPNHDYVTSSWSGGLLRN